MKKEIRVEKGQELAAMMQGRGDFRRTASRDGGDEVSFGITAPADAAVPLDHDLIVYGGLQWRRGKESSDDGDEVASSESTSIQLSATASPSHTSLHIEGYLDLPETPSLVIYSLTSICRIAYASDTHADEAREKTLDCYRERISMRTERGSELEIYPAAKMGGESVYDYHEIHSRFMSALYCNCIGAGVIFILGILGILGVLIFRELWHLNKFEFVAMSRLQKKGQALPEGPPSLRLSINSHDKSTWRYASRILKNIGVMTLRRGFILVLPPKFDTQHFSPNGQNSPRDIHGKGSSGTPPATFTLLPPSISLQNSIPSTSHITKSHSKYWNLLAVTARFPSEQVVYTFASSPKEIFSLQLLLRIIVMLVGIFVSFVLCATIVYLFHAFDYSVSQSFIPALFVAIVSAILIRLILLYGNRHLVSGLSLQCVVTNHRVCIFYRVGFNMRLEYVYFDDVERIEAESCGGKVLVRVILKTCFVKQLSNVLNRRRLNSAAQLTPGGVDFSKPQWIPHFKRFSDFFKRKPQEECEKVLSMLRTQHAQFEAEKRMWEQGQIEGDNHERLSTESVILEHVRQTEGMRMGEGVEGVQVVWEDDDAQVATDDMSSTGSCTANLRTEITGTVVDDLFTTMTTNPNWERTDSMGGSISTPFDDDVADFFSPPTPRDRQVVAEAEMK